MINKIYVCDNIEMLSELKEWEEVAFIDSKEFFEKNSLQKQKR